MASNLYPIINKIQQESADALRHTFRMELETPIFDDLRAKYGSIFKTAWDTATFPAKSANTVLLVERREHPNVEFVLHNFMYFCKGFSLTIVCSDANEAYIRGILGKHAATTRILPIYKGIGTRDQGREEYNGLFTMRQFWEAMEAEYILSVQTDSYLRKPLPTSMFSVDYVAAPWAWRIQEVGGSGLTFRKREFCLDCTKTPYEGGGEDVFFSRLCALKNKKVLPIEERINTFSESCFSEDPVGVHQWWTYFVEYYTSGKKEMFSDVYDIYTTIHV